MTCSAPAEAPDLPARVAALLGRPTHALTRLAGGANSRVYRADTDAGPCAVKLYPSADGDTRDRLGAETAAASFLARHGVEGVPTVLATDRGQGMAAYRWLEGAPVETVGAADIDAALDFLGTLHGLRRAEGADALPMASEACLSLNELIAQVERRRARLLEGADTLRGFLDGEVGPVLAEAAVRARGGAEGGGATALPPALRTLSPSDFGFHNALRRPDGRLAFLDFEYFGWDDPVKLTADVLLHPGMTLTDEIRRRFADGARTLYGAGDPGFAARLAVTMPLYALRWSMIVLNEFLPERWEHRVRAGIAAGRAVVLDRQSTKARGLLTTARALLHGGPA